MGVLDLAPLLVMEADHHDVQDGQAAAGHILAPLHHPPSLRCWGITINLQKDTVINSSVADPECLSRIPDPDLYPSRIPDLGSRIQKQPRMRGVKKN
jgi:hypothetical protein